jgi:hypothetical protein
MLLPIRLFLDGRMQKEKGKGKLITDLLPLLSLLWLLYFVSY